MNDRATRQGAAAPWQKDGGVPLVAFLGGGSLALFVMVGRWTPGRILGRSEWWAIPPRIWAVAGLLLAVVISFLREPRAGRWNPALRSHVWRSLAFLGYMAFAVQWSRAGTYGTDKAALLGLIAATVVLAARLTYDAGSGMARAFWMWLASATAIYSIYTSVSGWMTVRYRVQRLVTPLGGGPNVFARLSALLTLVGVNYGTRGAWWMAWYGPAALGVVLTLATGSRGGLLAGIAGMLALTEAKGLLRRRGVLPAAILLSIVLTGVAMTGLWDNAIAVYKQRIVDMTFARGDDSSRFRYFENAWELGVSAPVFGTGLGGFYARFPSSEYCHNVMLEAFAEGGGVGLGLLIWVLGGAGLALFRRRRGDPGAATWAAFVTLLVACQFSGDTFDARLLFILPTLVDAPAATDTRGST
jgi:hypothetical protein